MNIEDIRSIAQHYKIECDGLHKGEIIRKIQMQNGQGNCFGTNHGDSCRYVGCYWRNDCFDAANVWLSQQA